MKEKYIIWVMVLASMFMLQGCQKKDAHGGFGGFAVSVVAQKVKKESIQEKISLVGNMAANEVVEIKSEIDGVVEKIGFDEGQLVKKDQVLIEVDRKMLEASLAQAQANLKLAETTKERYGILVGSNAISKQEFDQSVANLESMRAEVDKMNVELNDATITAPFDGVIGERLVSLGQFITMGSKLTVLINQDPMKAEFRVPEKSLSKLKEGQAIELMIAAYPDEKFLGEVYFIDPQLDELTRTTLVKARVPNSDGKLRRGMFANLDLIVNVKPNSLVIPEIALIPKSEEVYVFVVDKENKAQMRSIKTGVRLGGVVEVLSGLEEGESVITEGYQKIGPGSLVAIKQEQEQVDLKEVKK